MENYILKSNLNNDLMGNFSEKNRKFCNEIDNLKSVIDLLLQFKYMFTFVKKHCHAEIEFKIKTIAPDFDMDLENCHSQYSQLIDSNVFLEFVRERENFYENKFNSYYVFKRSNLTTEIEINEQEMKSMPESMVDTIITEMPIGQPQLNLNDEYSSNETSQSSGFKYPISNQENTKFNLSQLPCASQVDTSKKFLYENLFNFLPKTADNINETNTTSNGNNEKSKNKTVVQNKPSQIKQKKSYYEAKRSEQDDDISMHVENDLLQVEYWCSFENCRFKSMSLTQVKAHEERRHVRHIQKCSQDGCGSFFENKNELDTHVNQVHTCPKFHCAMDDCDKEFSSDYRLKQHIKDEHKDAYLTCKTCSKKFKTRKYLLKHIHNIHSKDKKNKDGCDKEISMSTQSTSAETKCSASIKCTIDDCNKKFIKKSKLKQHIREQHKEEYLTCKFCDKVCRTRNNLTNHIWIMHEEGDFKCTFENCDFASTYRKNLLNHKKLRHQRVRKCPIDQCGEMIPITRYQRHMSSLHKIKNYGCSWPDCGKSFADHNALKNHVRIHLNFKRFKCKWPECGYASEQRFTVITHIRVCHFKLPRTKKKQLEMNISQDSLQNPYDYLEVCREDICI